MQIPDLVNGLFEAVGGIMNWTNVMALYRDKKVRGVNPWATGLFTAWGFWNCFYYPSLNQWFSFAGGLIIVAGNFVWVVLAIKYRGK